MAKSLNNQIKELKVLSIGNTSYLGLKEKTETGYKITKAIEVEEGASFEASIKEWIKANNINQLIETEEEGMVAIGTKGFTEKQKMEIDIIASQAEYAIKYALGNLQNAAID